MDYASYFLIVSDYIKWVKKFYTSRSGRGSGAGSLVAYCLDITIWILLNLIWFWKIFKPDRISMPILI